MCGFSAHVAPGEVRTSRNDFVSDVDRGAEERIIDIVRRAYPDHAILAEESGQRTGQGDGAEFEWIIDPLDGTTNFLHGVPHFCVSIAVRHKGILDQGVIFDPVRQEIFSASRGSGAQVDGRRLRIGPRKELRGALLATGFPFRELENLDDHLEEIRRLTPRCGSIRRTGSAALDLAYVAAGRLDGFWEWGIKPWDIAAGALMVREAGGIITDEAGAQDFMSRGNVIAAAPKVHAALIPILRKSRSSTA